MPTATVEAFDGYLWTAVASMSMARYRHGVGVLLLDGHLYGYSDGRGWTCQNLQSGEVVWDSKKLGKGCVVYADKRLYCLAESSGTVALAAADTRGWKEYGRFEFEFFFFMCSCSQIGKIRLQNRPKGVLLVSYIWDITILRYEI